MVISYRSAHMKRSFNSSRSYRTSTTGCSSSSTKTTDGEGLKSDFAIHVDLSRGRLLRRRALSVCVFDLSLAGLDDLQQLALSFGDLRRGGVKLSDSELRRRAPNVGRSGIAMDLCGFGHSNFSGLGKLVGGLRDLNPRFL